MKKGSLLLILCLLFSTADIFADKKKQDQNACPVNNVILIIPDGASVSVLSLARWMQFYNQPDQPFLSVDPYIKGLVRTHCSNAPIGDSAPTASCYMTGVPSIAKYISIHPPATSNDIFPIDSTQAYRPLTTLLEASKGALGKSIGIVCKSEFPHATPAACISHTDRRDDYLPIISQMVHSSLDVMIGGGTQYLQEKDVQLLRQRGYAVHLNDLQGMRNSDQQKIWALFGHQDIPYRLDLDTTVYPTLEEMTQKAIDLLSANNKGFFLMVEASKVDWALHGNDVAGAYSEMQEADRAFQVAVEFAKRDKNTAVIMLPDHSTGGLQVGSYRCEHYSSKSQSELFARLSEFKRTAAWVADKIEKSPCHEIASIVKEYTGIDLTDHELTLIQKRKGCTTTDSEDFDPSDQAREYNSSLSKVIADLILDRSCITFATDTHTAEDVFFAVYHPRNQTPSGLVNNTTMYRYIASLFALEEKQKLMTQNNYIPHSQMLQGYVYEIEEEDSTPYIEIKDGKTEMQIKPYVNYFLINGKRSPLSSVVVYIPSNQTFYLPQEILRYLNR